MASTRAFPVARLAALCLLLGAARADAQVPLEVVHHFDYYGREGFGSTQLVEATDGNLYGTTVSGEVDIFSFEPGGTVFRLAPDGQMTVLHRFTGLADGQEPYGRLIQANDGSLYGTTLRGRFGGTIYRVSLQGAVTTLHHFSDFSDGCFPQGLTQGSDGNFYGTTGGCGAWSGGTAFRFTPGGKLVTLHHFGRTYERGLPQDIRGSLSPLVEMNGVFYGTATTGEFSWVFRLQTNGTVDVVAQYEQLPFGSIPKWPSALVLSRDGNVYGIAPTSDPRAGMSAFFRLAPSGSITELVQFSDATMSWGAPIEAADGSFYATKPDAIVRFRRGGTAEIVRRFDDKVDGSGFLAGLVQTGDGLIYGGARRFVYRLRPYQTSIPARLTATRTAAPVNLAWDPVDGAVGYRVKRGTSAGQLAVIATVSSAQFFDPTAVPGTTYYYTVSALTSAFESADAPGIAVTVTRPQGAGDFDDDGAADLAVYRPGTGGWLLRNLAAQVTSGGPVEFDVAEDDVPVDGDYDGDGKDDFAVYRPSPNPHGRPLRDYGWFIVPAATGKLVRYFSACGFSPSTPVPADYTGDGRIELAVFCDETWFLTDLATGVTNTYAWGLSGDIPVPGDYDGDGHADLAVYRPANGSWYVFSPTTGTHVSYQWGISGDVPVPKDYDRDGRTDLAVWREAAGQWFIYYLGTNTWQAVARGAAGESHEDFLTLQWGIAGDTPLAADFDGDRALDLTVFRPSSGEWFVRYSSTGYSYAFASYQWGLSTDTPLVADFDGDGRTDLVVYRPSTGEWFVRYSSQAYSYAYVSYQWGVADDLPIPADFDGDGKADLAVYRPSTGEWFVRFSSSNYSYAGYATYSWGVSGDLPLPADFDGDGATDLVVYRPGNGTWYVRFSSSAYSFADWTSFQWGVPGDTPLVGDFDGDGRTDLTIFRPSSSEWFVRYSSTGYSYSGFATHQWGGTGDVPMMPR
jgi:uncharacterized repeat protein (TIGR03803 family)